MEENKKKKSRIRVTLALSYVCDIRPKMSKPVKNKREKKMSKIVKNGQEIRKSRKILKNLKNFTFIFYLFFITKIFPEKKVILLVFQY